MNFNMSLICEACETQTNCRIGMSNRHEFYVCFACQECSNIIEVHFKPGESHKYIGARRLGNETLFDQETNFVDLHPDFPVAYGKYVMGNTPFMQALQRQGHDEVLFHQFRTNYLNQCIHDARKFETLLKHYKREKIRPFELNLKKHFDINMKTHKPQDINAALYSLIAKMMNAFTFPNQDAETVQVNLDVLGTIQSDSPQAIQNFIDEVLDKGFLKKVQFDCLDIYPEILNSDMVFRPALFLDFDESYAESPIPMRVSTDDFQSFKDLYKDIAEIISKLLVLVAGVNNLAKRADHDKFKLGIGQRGRRDLTPTSLEKFADVAYGLKMDMIDDSWFEFVDEAVDNQLRNAIAHVKTEYDDITQIITYYPKKEGLKSERPETITFLEFIRRILISYREMHRMHHLVKALFYHHYLLPRV